MAQNQQALDFAREFIKEKDYAKARSVLRKIADDPMAQKILAKLDEVAPENAPTPATSNGATSAGVSAWQYGGLEVKRSYGIQYRFNGAPKPEWKDQPIYYVLNELGKEGWELCAFESISEFTNYILKKPGLSAGNKKIEVWDQ